MANIPAYKKAQQLEKALRFAANAPERITDNRQMAAALVKAIKAKK